MLIFWRLTPISDSGRLPVRNWCKHVLLLYCDLMIILPKIATRQYVCTIIHKKRSGRLRHGIWPLSLPMSDIRIVTCELISHGKTKWEREFKWPPTILLQ